MLPALNVHVYSAPSVQGDLPDVSFDTPIILGGGMKEICLEMRARYLRASGFANITIDPDISFSTDHLFDTAFG